MEICGSQTIPLLHYCPHLMQQSCIQLTSHHNVHFIKYSPLTPIPHHFVCLKHFYLRSQRRVNVMNRFPQGYVYNVAHCWCALQIGGRQRNNASCTFSHTYKFIFLFLDKSKFIHFNVYRNIQRKGKCVLLSLGGVANGGGGKRNIISCIFSDKNVFMNVF